MEYEYYRLPLLEHITSLLKKDIFKNCFLIACQHLLPSTHLMLRSMFDKGLPIENVALIGKCYSSSQKTITNMLKDGIYVCPSSILFNSHKSFDDQFKKNVHNFLKQQIKKLKLTLYQKIIILDDGGELILSANKLLKNFNVIGVEQTTSGYNKIKAIKVGFPVINVARSYAKLTIESPMIANSQAEKLYKNIKLYNKNIKNILLIGNGAIGKALFNVLSNQYKTLRYDKNYLRSDISYKELDLKNFDLIIGTTGNTVLSANHYNLLDKTIMLASASSSDIEFSAVQLRRKIQSIKNCHENIMINNVNLLNCGFPINFLGGDKDTVPLSKIQLTIGLLFSGIAQAVCKQYNNSGFIKLDHFLQNEIMKKFQSLQLNSLKNKKNLI